MFVVPLPPLLPEQIASRLGRRPGLFWLDGQSDHPDGRYSFLGSDPVAQVSAGFGHPAPLSLFELLADRRPGEARPRDEPTEGPPSCRVPRWVGYIAYDAFASSRPVRLPRPAGQPVVSFARYDAVVACCHRSGRCFAVGDDRAACLALRDRLADGPVELAPPSVGPLSVVPAGHHRAALGQVLRHIARGDVYQVNLARSWRCELSGPPLSLWSRLRAASPVPLGFYFDDGARVVMSRTMERFLRFGAHDRRLATCPIKGTIARTGSDSEAAARLRADPKEHAEHAMIVDLMRNDLGRVAEVGSVEVADAMRIEPYSRLLHMVSTVRCRTRPDVDLRAILEATFPPGSVTGAPKLAAIDIIEALEATPRDAYCGAVGFVDRAGGLSLAVAIRTAIAAAGSLSYWAGGGIVEASDIEREIAETELKARVFLDALAALQPLASETTPSPNE